jgi:tetratricopeptide (TPR) repeat protein
VAKKGKQHKGVTFAPAELQPRIERASNEGRYQQALDLAKQLYKYEPTPANKELLLRTYLGRARQLRTSGYVRDAVTVLEVALTHAGKEGRWLKEIAHELSACGAGARALALLGDQADPEARAKVLAQAADNAIAQGAAGRAGLAPEWHADFDRILQAAAQVEAGQDDKARDTLQAIGLRSPFLDWKLLLRGLSAYYHKEDARALENWQRLSAERLPSRVIAPLRFTIDPAYRAAQSPQAQTALQRQVALLQPQDLVARLRAIQRHLSDEHSFSQVFSLAAEVVPALRQHVPALVPRLAACCYWGIVNTGSPADIPRHQRVFGAPHDDPNFSRLRALALEHYGEMATAHREWQTYERSVAAHPEAWPGDQATHVRALIWKHMGMNAAAGPQADRLPPFLRDLPEQLRPLKPTADECFRKSLELVPNQLDTLEELLHFYLDQKKLKQAEQTARDLLGRFPNHVSTLESLADLRSEANDYQEAIALLERATQANPLDRRLRDKLSTTHLFQARAHAEAKRFDEARAEFRTALALNPRDDNSAVYCKMAACEFKAGDEARAEEYLQKAQTDAGSRLAVAYSMLIEVIRLKLPGKLKTRFNKDFNALLAEPPDPASTAGIAATASAHRIAGITYHGQKTHEKKVLGYIQKALTTAALSEVHIDRICESLRSLEAPKPLQAYAEQGQQRFPNNPYFYYWEVEAHILRGPYRCPIWRVQSLIADVRRRLAQMPPDSRKDAVLETLKRREEMVASLSPFGRMYSSFGQMFEEADDDEYDDDDDGW